MGGGRGEVSRDTRASRSAPSLVVAELQQKSQTLKHLHEFFNYFFLREKKEKKKKVGGGGRERRGVRPRFVLTLRDSEGSRRHVLTMNRKCARVISLSANSDTSR